MQIGILFEFFKVALASEQSELLVAHAHSLLQKQKWHEAAQAYRSLLTVDPHSWSGFLGLQTALLSSGKQEEAYNYILARIEGSLGQKRQKWIQRLQVLSSLFLSNKVFQSYQEGMNWMWLKKYRLAQDSFQKVLAEDSHHVLTLVRVGQCFVLEGRLSEGIQVLSLARSLNPFEPVIGLWLGRALVLRGEVTDGLQLIQSVENALVGSEQLVLWLAEAWLADGKKNNAHKLLMLDLKKYPHHLRALIALSQMRLHQERVDLNTWLTLKESLQFAIQNLPQQENQWAIIEKNEWNYDSLMPITVIEEELKNLCKQVQVKIKSFRKSA